MADKNTQHQALLYAYDLGNRANEHGFKADEGWELGMASVEKKASLEKQYHPVVSLKVIPENLAELFRLVKDRLSEIRPGYIGLSNPTPGLDQDLQYLVAYSPKRVIR